MKQVVIEPAPLHGTVTPPPSKSAAHRAIICAALAQGESALTPRCASDDIDATVGVMRALGTVIDAREEALHITGCGRPRAAQAVLNCHESGSTLRFLIPVAAVSGGCYTFTGSGRLPARPIGPYLECLPRAGVACKTAGGLPLVISGGLQNGVFTLPGNVSSQFITGLLLALPLLPGGSRILLTSALESAGYIDMTLDVMARFGVTARRSADGFDIPGGQQYQPRPFRVEGDWSQAAFWLAAGALGGQIACEGLDAASAQGDRAIVSLLRRFGALCAISADGAQAQAAPLHGIEIDAAQIPDLVPVLTAVASFAKGRTVIKNAARLRIKESDRLQTVAAGLRAFGAKISELPDGLDIEGAALHGGEADGAGDHRIVMALSVAASRCAGRSVIRGCEAVNKSYPTFFEDFNRLGGRANVIDLG